METGNGAHAMAGLKTSLLSLRLGVFVVLFAWTLDKFLDPAHGSRVFDAFFGIEGVGSIAIHALGILELILVVAFVSGSFKRISYGLVLMLHGITTLVTIPSMVTDPFGNLLFFAAFPMLAACWTLYVMRDHDTLLTVKRGKSLNA
uniref:hypothetical protein n=1 Tax=Halomonas sp. TaxID=1486246 RepID=UPI00261F7FBC|nr:hypothetical protein [Halomonas sp.]